MIEVICLIVITIYTLQIIGFLIGLYNGIKSNQANESKTISSHSITKKIFVILVPYYMLGYSLGKDVSIVRNKLKKKQVVHYE